MIVKSAIKLGDVVIDDDTLYWSEIRLSEKGRSVVMMRKQNRLKDVTSSPIKYVYAPLQSES